METLKDTRPSNTVESFILSLPSASANGSRQIVRGAVERAVRMGPIKGHRYLYQRLGIDLDPDFEPGRDDGCGPKGGNG